MPRAEQYDVQRGRRSKRDSSYRSFLCALLIFFVLCIIIILVGNWASIFGGRKSKSDKKKDSEYFVEDSKQDPRYFEKLKEGNFQSTTPVDLTHFEDKYKNNSEVIPSTTTLKSEKNEKRIFNLTTTTTTTTTTSTTTTTTKDDEDYYDYDYDAVNLTSSTTRLVHGSTAKTNETEYGIELNVTKVTSVQSTTLKMNKTEVSTESRVTNEQSTTAKRNGTEENTVSYVIIEQSSTKAKSNETEDGTESRVSSEQNTTAKTNGTEDSTETGVSAVQNTSAKTNETDDNMEAMVNYNQSTTAKTNEFDSSESRLINYQSTTVKTNETENRKESFVTSDESNTEYSTTATTNSNIDSAETLITNDPSTTVKINEAEESTEQTTTSESNTVKINETEDSTVLTLTQYVNNTVKPDETEDSTEPSVTSTKNATAKTNETEDSSEPSVTSDENTTAKTNETEDGTESMVTNDHSTTSTAKNVEDGRVYIVTNDHSTTSTAKSIDDGTESLVTNNHSTTTPNNIEDSAEPSINETQESSEPMITKDQSTTAKTYETEDNTEPVVSSEKTIMTRTYETVNTIVSNDQTKIVRTNETENSTEPEVTIVQSTTVETNETVERSNEQSTTMKSHYMSTLRNETTENEDNIDLMVIQSTTSKTNESEDRTEVMVTQNTSEKVNDAEDSTESVATEDQSAATVLAYEITTLKNSAPKIPQCVHQSCKMESLKIISHLRETEDQCDDFYAYTCSDNAHHVPPPTNTWKILLKEIRNITENQPHYWKYKVFFDQCTKFHYQYNTKNTIAEVKKVLSNLYLDQMSFGHVDLTHILSTLLIYDSLYFLQLGTGINEHTGQINLQLGLSLHENDWSTIGLDEKRCFAQIENSEPNVNVMDDFIKYQNCSKNLTNFGQIMVDAIAAFGYDDFYLLNYTENLKKKYLHPYDIKNATVQNSYQVYNVTMLKAKYPLIEWNRFLSNILSTNINEYDLVQIYFPEYLADFLNTLNKSKEYKQVLIYIFASDLYYNFVMRRETSNVEEMCVKTATSLFPDVASSIYVKHFEKDLSDHQFRATKIFKLLKDNLKDSPSKDDFTASAQSKAQHIKLVVSNKNEILSDSELVDNYKSITVNGSYVKNYMEAKKLKWKNVFKSNKYIFGKLVNSFDTTAVAFYEKDSIYVPLGMLVNVPLDLPEHVALAKIGFPMATALTKHFDGTGIKYRTSINPVSYDDFASSTIHIVNSINKKEFGIEDFMFENEYDFTTNQRISDSMGLRLLTNVYPKLVDNTSLVWISDNYTAEQITLISVAQELCEYSSTFKQVFDLYKYVRVSGIVRIHYMFMNSHRFGEVFQCPQGTKMNIFEDKKQFPVAVEPSFSDN